VKSYAQIALRSVETNGITINVAVGGKGPAVLLLHGWPHTWQIWHRVVPLLTDSFKVIAPDLRGIGGTTRALGGYDLNTLAGDAAGLLTALDVDDANVVGIDLGVQIATMVAIRYRARTRRMIVVEVAFELPDEPSVVEQVIEAVFQVHSYQEPVIRLQSLLSSKSKGHDDSQNPNRWWNTTGDWKRAAAT